MSEKVALITGAAKRIGAAISKNLHQQGYRVILHYNKSSTEANQLRDNLNQLRADSAHIVQADLNQHQEVLHLAESAINKWQRIDLLINNASVFYPTPLIEITEDNWHNLFASNAKAPLFLTQQLTSTLKKNQGSIVNIIDIYGSKPLKGYSIYCMAKASLRMMTQSLALELAPDVRVNGIAPGIILWPDSQSDFFSNKQGMIEDVPMKKTGSVEDITKTVLFLAEQAPYITGQIICVDGGYSLVR